MVNDYIEYLQQINNNLMRNGIDTNVKLTEATLEDDVNVIDQYLYFNEVLKRCDSSYKILDILGYKDSNLYDFLREEFYSKYNEEWLERSKNVTVQPENAGRYLSKVDIVSPLEIKVFTESLNLEQPLVLKQENIQTFSQDELDDESEYVYDYDGEDNEEDEHLDPIALDIKENVDSSVKSKIDEELKEITPLYKSIMLDDDDIDIDYTDKEPDLSVVNMDFGGDEELDELDYDEYSDSEIADLLKETDEEISEFSKPKVIDYKKRRSTIEADKIVELVNNGMTALFNAIYV